MTKDEIDKETQYKLEQQRKEDAIKKGEYFLVFDDKDIEELSKLKIQNKEDEIDDFIEVKFKQLI